MAVFNNEKKHYLYKNNTLNVQKRMSRAILST